jgi:hypothetical protein
MRPHGQLAVVSPAATLLRSVGDGILHTMEGSGASAKPASSSKGSSLPLPLRRSIHRSTRWMRFTRTCPPRPVLASRSPTIPDGDHTVED